MSCTALCEYNIYYVTNLFRWILDHVCGAQACAVKEFLIGMVKVTVKVFFISKGKGNAISNCEVEKNNSDCFSLE